LTNLHEYGNGSTPPGGDTGIYDVAIVGGGLAGLALSIQCTKAGYRVVVFEKEKYPFHKVCGEYISLEAWDFLERLGVPLSEMNLPVIRKLLVSAPNGKLLEQTLPLGGFGISRYKLDSLLADIARKSGAKLLENIKAESLNFENGIFNTRYGITTVQSQIAAAGFGKRSNLDIKWKRGFTVQKNNRLNNYIGVKYHVQTDYPAGQIGLHNFKYGYCGISQIEDGKYCLCYMTRAKNLQENGNSLPEMEKKILQKNPHLKNIFSSSIFLTEPVTISQISFDNKTQVENHILFVGDAAGMITPLCGNGMSMALHASKLAFEQIHNFLQKKISREQMENAYQQQWRLHFHKRLSTGRTLQRFFGSTVLSNLLISSLKPFPGVVRRLIRATHGQSF
jgi:flavin-dependent dehydrogenase